MERLGILKLNGGNYSVWKTKVEFLLIREDLWRYITGAGPEATAAAAVKEAWTSGDQKARATIGLLLEDNQLNLIKDCKTAKDTWEKLKGHYEKATLTSKVSILKRICDKRYSDGEDIEQHVFEMEGLFERLTLAGEELSKSMQVAMVLRSLPESFSTLTTALESRSDEELTLDLVKSKVVDEVAKRRSSGASESVLKSHVKQKKLLCHFCQKPGHKQKDCRSWIEKRNGEGKSQEDHREKRNQPRVRAARQEAQKKQSMEFSFVTKATATASNAWIIDSGATSHMCANRTSFVELDESSKQEVILADGTAAKAEGIGSCQVTMLSPEGEPSKVTLKEVLLVPNFESNLVSVKKLASNGATVIFDVNGCRILKDKKVIAGATISGGLYCLKVAQEALAAKHTPKCQHMWHRVLGHRDHEAVRDLVTKNMATGIEMEDCGCRVDCECCLEGKLTRLPFPKKSDRKSNLPLDLIHTDVCGPMQTVTPGGCRYFLTMIDDFTRFTVVYFLKKKSEVPLRVQEYVQCMKTEFGKTPKIIRSDQGGEYRSDLLDSLCRAEGIRQQFTTAYTPQQNGVAERKNRSLVEMARCMILDSQMPLKYWAEAVNTANYLQNRLPTKPLKKTPFELWNGTKPDMSHLKMFGSPAYVWIPKEKRSKLEAKSRRLLFVGYSSQHKAYRFMDPSNDKLTVSRDCRFLSLDEVRTAEPQQGSTLDYPFKLLEQTRADVPVIPANTEESEDESDESKDESDESDFCGFETSYDDAYEETFVEDEAQEDLGTSDSQEEQDADNDADVSVVRRSKRSTKGIRPERYHDTVRIAAQHEDEPRTFDEAMSSPERGKWKQAMEEELQSLHENATWDVVRLPPNRKPVGCKWIYKKKMDESGNVIRYKARLVAQGFSQKYGTDYDEVFAPVAKQTTFRTLLSVAARRGMQVKHVDVKTAYLYGELEETIFMKQPIGFHNGTKDEVCLLRKSLYGIKQAGRVWNAKISEVLKKLGYVPSDADPCLFVKTCKKKKSFILLYVDDMLIITNTEAEYESVRKHLAEQFTIMCLGDVKHYLGIQVTRSGGQFFLNQEAYIERVAERFGQANAKRSLIPMDPGYPNAQQKEEEPMPRNDEFQSLVGALLYIAVNTRPDIAISASILGRKVSRPTEVDWTEAKRTLRYLRSTANLSLRLGSPGPLEAYVDADWAGDKADRKSNTGFVFSLGGSISWAARKQPCVTLSSTEAEYVALSEASRELMWLLKLLKDVGEQVPDPVVVNEDNQSCIAMLKSAGGSKRTKHIDTRYNYVKELVNDGVMDVRYCPSEQMVADGLTKPLARVKMEKMRLGIGLQPAELEEE